MKNKLTEQEKKLYRQVDEVLHYMWDPIGVRGIAQARDEYYSYLPQVFSRLVNNGTTEDIASYLVAAERDSMGLTPDKGNAMNIAETLLGLKEAIIDDGF